MYLVKCENELSLDHINSSLPFLFYHKNPKRGVSVADRDSVLDILQAFKDNLQRVTKSQTWLSDCTDW